MAGYRYEQGTEIEPPSLVEPWWYQRKPPAMPGVKNSL